MITIEESIPTKSENYRISEDIFFIQFNDVSFYIEDEEQENFFFCILKNLFSDINIERIFPLNGKDNVIEQSQLNVGNKKKVFIVDRDFDDIFNRLVAQPNLFYLDRYSIENHLLEEGAFIKYIISEKPKLKISDVKSSLKFEKKMKRIFSSLDKVINLHLVVQFICPQLPNVALSHERFFQFNAGSFIQRTAEISQYEQRIKTEITNIDRRLTVNGQVKNLKKNIINLKTYDLYLKHIPGKYLIRMIKQIVESEFGLVSRNADSFNYRIAEKCHFESLEDLKDRINNHLN